MGRQLSHNIDPTLGIRPVLPDLNLSGVFEGIAGVQSYLGAIELAVPNETKEALGRVIRKVNLIYNFQIENEAGLGIDDQRLIEIDRAFNQPLGRAQGSMVNWMNTIHPYLFDRDIDFQAGKIDPQSSLGEVRNLGVIESQIRYLEDYLLRNSSGHRLIRIVTSLSVHQRLNYLEPYRHGSGLVSRLLLERYLSGEPSCEQIGFKLLPIARGFAGQDIGVTYKREMHKACAWAASPSKKGELCPRSLLDFLMYCTETMCQQAQIIYSYLRRDNFKENLLNLFYFIDSKHANQMLALYLRCFDEGVFERMTAASVCGLSERASRDILKKLADLGFLTSNSPKGKLTIGFPFIYLGRIFPRLMPVDYERRWEPQILFQKQQMRLF